MQNRLNPIRLLPALAALVALAVAVAGCGTGSADTERGRTLFVQKCGTCHTMAQAGTSAQIGPDLDDAFAAARASGQDDDTIAGVTAAQVEYPRPSTQNPANSMPPEIVTGKDLEDVAAYVGLYAGVPGAAPPKVSGGPGAQVFANNGCGGCHTFTAANAGGTVGPDLDVLKGKSFDFVHKSIVEPDAEVAPGYAAGIMPSNYEQIMSPKEIDDLVKYLLENATGSNAS